MKISLIMIIGLSVAFKDTLIDLPEKIEFECSVSEKIEKEIESKYKISFINGEEIYYENSEGKDLITRTSVHQAKNDEGTLLLKVIKGDPETAYRFIENLLRFKGIFSTDSKEQIPEFHSCHETPNRDSVSILMNINKVDSIKPYDETFFGDHLVHKRLDVYRGMSHIVGLLNRYKYGINRINENSIIFDTKSLLISTIFFVGLEFITHLDEKIPLPALNYRTKLQYRATISSFTYDLLIVMKAILLMEPKYEELQKNNTILKSAYKAEICEMIQKFYTYDSFDNTSNYCNFFGCYKTKEMMANPKLTTLEKVFTGVCHESNYLCAVDLEMSFFENAEEQIQQQPRSEKKRVIIKKRKDPWAEAFINEIDKELDKKRII